MQRKKNKKNKTIWDTSGLRSLYALEDVLNNLLERTLQKSGITLKAKLTSF